MNNPFVTFLIGLPASGKSTFCERNYATVDHHRYSTDDEIEAIAKREGKTYSDVFKDAYKEANRIANQKLDWAINDGKDNVVWDQTNLSSAKRIRSLESFGDNYVKIGAVFLPPLTLQDVETLKHRLDSRPGKTIPWHVITNMIGTFEIPTIDEGFDRLKFYDSFRGDFFPTEIFNIQQIFEYFRFSREYAELDKAA
ncbi:putative polyA polymerase [Sinorhizobium phage phiN3]|uniref:Putative polyA polymerase n=1 Tax=Sinorhizobium phage phiN3 TaxID=1647405 RepID=A0A0F6SJ64_9CAUD|nr:putative polyA polymerase [Sinorhizobium phage phiN3]AKF13658.1 putative polyA polymerase [Sinorhizobium phage phiN3]